jgi:hypothetical protein
LQIAKEEEEDDDDDDDNDENTSLLLCKSLLNVPLLYVRYGLFRANPVLSFIYDILLEKNTKFFFAAVFCSPWRPVRPLYAARI